MAKRCVDCALCELKRLRLKGLNFHCARTHRALSWKKVMRTGCPHWLEQRPAEFRIY